MSEIVNKEMLEESINPDLETLPPSFSEVQKEVTSFIKQLRESRDLTQSEVANQIGITQNGFAKLERGDTKDISLSRLLSISKVFNIELGEMFSHTHEKKGVYIGDNSLNGNNLNSTNYNNANNELVIEVEKLKLELEYQKKLYEQMEKQNTLLEKLLEKSE